MRRAVSISLLVVFGWMLLAPVFAADAEAGLPPCCRRGGRHHCMMRMMAGSGGSKATTVSERCRCWPQGGSAAHAGARQARSETRWFAARERQTAVAAQGLTRGAICRVRSHPRRGPPELFLSTNLLGF